ncbi:hypothetical protein H4582DRAFT_2128992 [Lactarius indigo]|nr:hypothetical protein H4582DRAFT_2128992 [Lactarius indigo]
MSEAEEGVALRGQEEGAKRTPKAVRGYVGGRQWEEGGREGSDLGESSERRGWKDRCGGETVETTVVTHMTERWWKPGDNACMSILVSPSSTPNFQPIFEKALEEYKKKTGKNLTAHPLAAKIQGCNSPEAILTVLQGKADELNRPRSSDDRLTKWLNPTVNILNALSATLGEGAGSVFPPTKIIFSGIGILLVAAKSTVASRDVLVELFSRIESFFQRLKIYTKVPPNPVVTDELAKIMAEVLSILGIATKGIKERRISGSIFCDKLLLTKLRPEIFLKKVAGMNDLEDALQRFGELERRELLTGITQVTSDTGVLKDGV